MSCQIKLGLRIRKVFWYTFDRYSELPLKVDSIRGLSLEQSTLTIKLKQSSLFDFACLVDVLFTKLIGDIRIKTLSLTKDIACRNPAHGWDSICISSRWFEWDVNKDVGLIWKVVKIVQSRTERKNIIICTFKFQIQETALDSACVKSDVSVLL